MRLQNKTKIELSLWHIGSLTTVRNILQSRIVMNLLAFVFLLIVTTIYAVSEIDMLDRIPRVPRKCEIPCR